MLQLGGHAATATPEQSERVSQMLLDLAAWVDRNDSGTINYMEFLSAFRMGGSEVARYTDFGCLYCGTAKLAVGLVLPAAPPRDF